jgi:membrane-bound lytic murein transglycosylase D
VATLRALNPELRRWVTTGGRPYRLRVPQGAADGFAERYAMVPLDQRLLYVEHRVRPGETVSKIASRHGTSVRAIAAENKLRNPNRISVGTVLRIPKSGSTPSAAYPTRTAQKRPQSGSGKTGVHVVRRRETLTSIAQQYGTTPQKLARQNGLRSMNRIYPGQRLKISGAAVTPSTATARAASASSGPSKDPIMHTVRKGDTLYAIARAYNTSVSALRRWNRIGGTRIWPGDVIRIYH